MKLKNIADTLPKKIGIGLIAIATYFGSIHNAKGLWPFYTEIKGTSYGINLAFYTVADSSADFYGLQIGLISRNRGSLNGMSIGLSNATLKGVTNGLEAAIQNVGNGQCNGVALGLFNANYHESAEDAMNGLQLGIINESDNGNYMQIGIVNKSLDKRSMILNSQFGEVKK